MSSMCKMGMACVYVENEHGMLGVVINLFHVMLLPIAFGTATHKRKTLYFTL
jgi:hypothetical protein